MDFKEACHRLRVTPVLLKWFTRYAAKQDGVKLREVSPGDFEATDLDAFDQHLKAAWTDRYVPAGISEELRVEARGRCSLCDHGHEKLDEAHIERKDVEVGYYSQHPNNLILLCKDCHARYDDMNLKQLDIAVVRHAKGNVVARKMAAIDADVERARALRSTVDTLMAEFRQAATGSGNAAPALLWMQHSNSLLSATATIIGAEAPAGTGSTAAALQSLSGWLPAGQPLTHAVIDGYALQANGDIDDLANDWDLLDGSRPPHECWCGDFKDSVEYQCLDCGHFGYCGEPIQGVTRAEDGSEIPEYEDAAGRTYSLACEKCESSNLDLSYEEYCSRCQHKFARDD